MSDAKNIFELYVESNEEPQMHVDRQGAKAWTLNNELHRVDGPALEYPKGGKQWYQHGKRHRIGAPAVDYPDGYKEWYQHGILHRCDGPAREWPDGGKQWHVNGHEYTDLSEWAKAALKYEKKPITQDAIDAKIQQVMQQDLFA